MHRVDPAGYTVLLPAVRVEPGRDTSLDCARDERRRRLRVCAPLFLLGLLAACAGSPPPSAGYKLGKPYTIGGRTYVPTDERDYRETGVASWYGPGFAGKRTANGEIFDPNELTAAHRTLPLPSFVEVTNAQNGRTIVVRVNDRGPFARDRIIDLSRRAAQLLGFESSGIARVQVRRVYPQGTTVAAVPSPPREAVLYVQIGAFADSARAQSLARDLGGIGPVLLEPVPSGLTRVRLGPFAAWDDAQQALSAVHAAGYSQARLLPDS